MKLCKQIIRHMIFSKLKTKQQPQRLEKSLAVCFESLTKRSSVPAAARRWDRDPDCSREKSRGGVAHECKRKPPTRNI